MWLVVVWCNVACGGVVCSAEACDGVAVAVAMA